MHKLPSGALLAALALAVSTFVPVAAGARPAGGDVPSGLTESILTATHNTTGSALGHSVAVSGTTVVVGADQRPVGVKAAAGVVEIYDRPASGWRAQEQIATLTAPSPGTNALFGYSVAISGRTIVVGAVEQDNVQGVETGEAFVYTEPRGGWLSTNKPAAVLSEKNGVKYDDFGGAVAVAGHTIVVGAYGVGGTFDGAAFVFNEPATGWKTMTESGQLETTTGSADFEFFGGAVAISGDTILVSGWGRYNNAGRVFVYVKPASGWTTMPAENRQLVGSGETNSYFGISIAISGATVVVGQNEGTVDHLAKAGSAYVFVRPAGGWGSTTVQQLPPDPTAVLTASDPGAGAELGDAVGIGGGRIVAAAIDKKVGNNQSQGELYVFLPQSGHWATEDETSTITASNGAAGDEFGQTLAVGPTAIVAGAMQRAANTGGAYVYAKSGPTLSEVAQAHRTWRLGTAKPVVNPAKKPTGGTSFRLTLSQPAVVTLAFAEKVGKHVRHRGVLRFAGRAGVNTVYVDGPTSHGKKLTPGHCSVAISARNVNGSTAPRTLHFVTTKRR